MNGKLLVGIAIAAAVAVVIFVYTRPAAAPLPAPSDGPGGNGASTIVGSIFGALPGIIDSSAAAFRSDSSADIIRQKEAAGLE